MEQTKLVELCKGRSVWIQTHNFPDPDAIASAFALQKLLERFGIEANLCHEGEIDKLSSGKMLRLLGIQMNRYCEIVGRMQKTDRIILVDSQKEGGNVTDLPGNEFAVIDHHPTVREAVYEYADIRITGACASLIAEYYKALDVTPSKETATALLYGIRMDTLQLSRGVTEFDIQMYAYLFPYADAALLKQLESNNMELADLRAYGAAIENIRIYGKTAFSYLDFACPDALVAILSDFFLSIAEVEVVILFAGRKDGYKFSFRSEQPDLNAGKLAELCLQGWGNGGGHASMAGGFAPKEAIQKQGAKIYEQVQEHCIAVLRELYPQALPT